MYLAFGEPSFTLGAAFPVVPFPELEGSAKVARLYKYASVVKCHFMSLKTKLIFEWIFPNSICASAQPPSNLKQSSACQYCESVSKTV